MRSASGTIVSALVLSAEPADADAFPELPMAFVAAFLAELTAVVAALAVELDKDTGETKVVEAGAILVSVVATLPEDAFVVAVPDGVPPNVLI